MIEELIVRLKDQVGQRHMGAESGMGCFVCFCGRFLNEMAFGGGSKMACSFHSTTRLALFGKPLRASVDRSTWSALSLKAEAQFHKGLEHYDFFTRNTVRSTTNSYITSLALVL